MRYVMPDDKKPKRSLSSTKAGGYATQKKYHATHPEKVKEWRRKQKEREKGTIYEPKIRLQIEYKPVLEKLLADTGMSITTICLTALEEKYGVVLQKHLDSGDE